MAKKYETLKVEDTAKKRLKSYSIKAQKSLSKVLDDALDALGVPRL